MAFGEGLRGRSGNGSFSHFIVTENCVYKFDFGSNKKKKKKKAEQSVINRVGGNCE